MKRQYISLILLALFTYSTSAIAQSEDGTRAKLSPEALQLIQLDETLQQEEARILQKLQGNEPQKLIPSGSPSSRYVVSPKVKDEKVFTSIAQNGQRVNYSAEEIRKLQFEAAAAEGTIANIDREFSALEIRSHIIDHSLDEASEDLRKIRTKKLITVLATEKLQDQVMELPAIEEPAPRVAQKPMYDIPVLKRVADSGDEEKVHLAMLQSESVPFRSGPASTFTSLFRGVKGEQVSVERRHENWYRVINSTGVRGWVSAEDLLFGADNISLPGKIIRVKAYDIASDRTDWES